MELIREIVTDYGGTVRVFEFYSVLWIIFGLIFVWKWEGSTINTVGDKADAYVVIFMGFLLLCARLGNDPEFKGFALCASVCLGLVAHKKDSKASLISLGITTIVACVLFLLFVAWVKLK